MKVKVKKTVEEFVDITPPAYFQRNLLPNLTIFLRVYLEGDKLHYDQLTRAKDSYNFACKLYFDELPDDAIPSTQSIWCKELSKFLDFIIKYCEEETK